MFFCGFWARIFLTKNTVFFYHFLYVKLQRVIQIYRNVVRISLLQHVKFQKPTSILIEEIKHWSLEFLVCKWCTWAMFFTHFLNFDKISWFSLFIKTNRSSSNVECSVEQEFFTFRTEQRRFGVFWRQLWGSFLPLFSGFLVGRISDIKHRRATKLHRNVFKYTLKNLFKFYKPT